MDGFPPSSVARRIHTSALFARARHCVRCVFCCRRFSLARVLSSTSSADSSAWVSHAFSSLFGGFSGTTTLSDSPCSFIVGLPPQSSQRGQTGHLPQANMGSPGSRVQSFRACSRSSTTGSPSRARQFARESVAFRLRPRRRHSRRLRFRGSILGLRFPLSTLGTRPHGRAPMTRGRCDWLSLHRRELSSPTPYRF
jgi:hypothetical protein